MTTDSQQQKQADTIAELRTAMVKMGFDFGSGQIVAKALTGGVSSDIWRVDLPTGPVVAKRALAQLKVGNNWNVPVQRNHYEVSWFNVVNTIVPQAIPTILAADEAAGIFVMSYLAPETHPVWKNELASGRIDTDFAAQLASTLACIHSKTANKPELSTQFDTDELFRALRPSPYFNPVADRHPALKARLEQISEQLFANKKALVHGDISPKNILQGAQGPILLDAECAWYGDPAFDLAFCLNHLLLKTLWHPEFSQGYLQCFDRLSATYLSDVDWEPSAELEQRAAALLPALLIARIDGKSPVEYIHNEDIKEQLRAFASQLLLKPVNHLADIHDQWQQHNWSTKN